ncbi:MAG: ABC transporter substrate-binding protein [Chloroflexi bacterium]|nr:ABC transporter substrate-binding protein [Chloroflexota bacterium]
MQVLKSYAAARMSGVFVLLLIAALSVSVAVASCSSEEPTPTPVQPAPTAVPPTATPVPATEAPEPEEPAGEPIKIGTLIDATGDLAAFGPPIVLATDLAALLINEAGGIDGRPIEMVHRDSGTSPQIATDAASALVNVDGVEAIVGSLSSGVTLAVAESVTIPNGAVLVSPASTSPAITNLDDNDTVFRTTVSDALQGVIAAQLAKQLGYENVATLYINNAYGEGLSNVFQQNFESQGGTVSAAVPIEGGQASYASELRQASQGDAEVLMALSYPETAGVYLREAVEGQYFDDFMFVDGTKNQEMFDNVGADNFEGNYGTAPGAPGTPTQEAFKVLYSSKLDGDPSSLFISEAFDAAVILALAIAESGSEDGDDVKAAMRKVANAPGEKVGPGDLARALQLISEGADIDYVGAAGDQDFDENGDVQNTIEVWKIDSGQVTSTGIFASPGDSIDISAAPTAMEPSDEPIKIGTLIDATGDLAVFGPPIVLATDLAALLINESGGIDGRQIEMIHRDSGTSPQIATDAASALVNVDGVEAIVGSLSSGVSLAVAESVTIPNGAVLVSPASTSPALSSLDDNDLVFRTTVSDAFQGVILAQVANELGYDNVATMYINNAYGEGLSTVFAETFESLGGTVSASVPIEGGQASYTSELRQASQGGATVLMAMSYPETAGVYLREAVEGQFFDEFMFVDGTKNQEMFDTVGADNFEGNYGTAPGSPGTPSQTAFQELYASKLGGDPSSIFISEAFDAAAILALAIAEAGSEDGDDIKAAIRKIANAPGEKVGPGDLPKALQLISEGKDIDYVGAAGEQEMDENGDVLNTIEIWKIEGGQITSTGNFVSAGDSIQLDAGPGAKRPGIGSEFAPSYTVGAGSKALFKVDETLRGADVVVSLETEALSGVVDFRADNASLEIDLHTLMSDQSRRDRYVRERMFPNQPVATVHFADLGDVPAPFIDGNEELKTKLTGTVNVNGTEADLEFDITARIDNGTDLVVLGTANFVWADFGMEAPVSQIFVVEDEVTVEILLLAPISN